jgi:hypothetical protein
LSTCTPRSTLAHSVDAGASSGAALRASTWFFFSVKGRLRWIWLLCALVVGVQGAHAKPYVDTKKRFSLEPAGGWELAPLPGDGFGMNFKKVVGGVPASLHVMVQPTTAGATLKQTLDAVEAGFVDEIGYRPGVETPTTVGGFSGTRRTLTVFASGDRLMVRAVELYAIHAFGHAHIVHVETLEKNRGAITRDVDRMLASYTPLVGRDVAAPLSGVWINTGGGPDLKLETGGEFRMGPLSGGWRTDGGVLELRIAAGTEKYRYRIEGQSLVLSSPHLDGDMIFRRSQAVFAAAEPAHRRPAGPLTREDLIGSWRVLDQAATEPLRLVLSSSGSVAFGGLSGRWRFSTGRLTLTSNAGETITYAVSLDEEQLRLSGGDLDKELLLERTR